MPALSAHDAAVMRQHPQTLKRYLSVCPRTPVFMAHIDPVSFITFDPQSGGMVEIGYTDVTFGTYSAVVPGLTLDFGSTPGGRDRGSVRIRDTATATHLIIAETAWGDLPGMVDSTTYLTVVDVRNIWNRLPLITEAKMTGQDYYSVFAAFADYDLTYVDEHKAFRPLANVVAQPAGWIDAGQEYRTVRLDSSLSAVVAKSATLTSRAWGLNDGTLVEGYTLTDTITYARFPMQCPFRYITLTVTDSNGKSSTRYVPIWVHSPAHPPLLYGSGGFRIERDETEQGREMDLILFGEVDAAREAVIPKGTLMCYWEDEVRFGHEEPPDQYRSHFLGWTLRDAVMLQLHRSTYRLTLGGPQSWLDRIGGQYELYQRRVTPAKWYHMADVTDDRIIATILRERSTALDVCNLYLSGVTWEWGNPDTSDKGAVELGQMSLWQQVVQLTQEYSGVAGVDSAGAIWLRQDPTKLLDSVTADRDDVPIVTTVTPADLLDESPLELPDEFIKPVARLDINGACWLGTSSDLYQGRAPTWTPGMGTQVEQVRDQVLDPTAPITHLSGLAAQWYAAANNAMPDVPLALLGNLDVIEPAWQEWVRLEHQQGNIRGMSVYERFLVKRISIQHANDPTAPRKRISWSMSRETKGYGGIAKKIIIPDVIDDNLTPYDDWFPGDNQGELPAPPGAASSPALTYHCCVTGLFRTHNFIDTTPTWEQIYTPASGHVCMDFWPDNLDCKNKATLIVYNGTTHTVKVLYTTNLNDAVPTFTEKQSLSYTIIQAELRTSNQFAGTWFLKIAVSGGGVAVVHTHDNWTSITTVDSGSSADGTRAVGFDLSLNAANVNNGVVWVGDRGSGNATVRKSLDMGHTFPIEKAVSPETYQIHMLYTPWWNNADELIVWASGGSSSTKEAFLMRSPDGGQTWVDRTPIYNTWGWAAGNGNYEEVRTNRILTHFVTDPAYMAIAGRPSMDRHGGPNSRLFTSPDEGVVWTDKGDLGQKVTMLGGWPYDKDILIATGDSKIQLSYDWGLTWEEKQWPGFADGIVTIPIWME